MRAIKILAAILTVIVLLLAVRFLRPKYDRYLRLSTERERVRNEHTRMGAEVQTLDRDLRRMDSDKNFIETQARRNSLARPGEVVFEFPIPAE